MYMEIAIGIHVYYVHIEFPVREYNGFLKIIQNSCHLKAYDRG
jgi:hypothetical protein